ncbi:MAG TPA: cyanase [Amycolatopsis sp.]|jgi:cyanate lyase|nr:cyanase [Amycolatopsis sp.]
MKPVISKEEAAKIIAAARVRADLPWERLAEKIGKPAVWTTAALLGQHALTSDDAAAIVALLDLDESIAESVAEALRTQPYRGPGEQRIPTDPTIYRFYEALMVYGPAIKELIHEKFGDGIMSAINFRLDVQRRPDPAGDRVVVTLDGKFLDYQW